MTLSYGLSGSGEKSCCTKPPSAGYVAPRVVAQPSDDWPNCFERPHAVSILMICLAAVWCFTKYRHEVSLQSNPRHNVILGVLASCFIFLVFSIVQLPNGILVRPHPLVWRLVKAISFMYLLLLVFLLFQDLDDVRRWLRYMDPSAGVPLPEIDYATDCRVFTPGDSRGPMANIQDRMDIFVAAHFFGWLVKALVVRDFGILTFLSVLFEFSELSFAHLLPNFHECWWDHVLMDVFGCNILGIATGLWLCRVFQMKKYRWTASNSVVGETSQIIETKKADWTKWPSFLNIEAVYRTSINIENFWMLMFFCFMVNQIDLNVFFLKAELWLAPSHWIVASRTFFWGFAAASGGRDFYEFTTDRRCVRLGMQGWLNLSIILTEFLLSIKFLPGLDRATQAPFAVKIGWACAAVVLIAISMCLKFKTNNPTTTAIAAAAVAPANVDKDKTH